MKWMKCGLYGAVACVFFLVSSYGFGQAVDKEKLQLEYRALSAELQLMATNFAQGQQRLQAIEKQLKDLEAAQPKPAPEKKK
jgi:hypothetical protein